MSKMSLGAKAFAIGMEALPLCLVALDKDALCKPQHLKSVKHDYVMNFDFIKRK